MHIRQTTLDLGQPVPHRLAYVTARTNVYVARCTCGRTAQAAARRTAILRLLDIHCRAANRDHAWNEAS